MLGDRALRRRHHDVAVVEAGLAELAEYVLDGLRGQRELDDGLGLAAEQDVVDAFGVERVEDRLAVAVGERELDQAHPNPFAGRVNS